MFLSQCKHQHALLNGTYIDCTKFLDDTLIELARVKKERDDALFREENLIKANKAKNKELKTAKADARTACMAEKKITRDIMTNMLAYTIRTVRGLNEKIFRLEALVATQRGELQSKQAILGATQGHLRRNERLVICLPDTIKRLRTNDRAMRKLMAAYLVVVQEYFARIRHTLGFFVG